MRRGTGHFADVAIRYAEQVRDGVIPACWQIRSSCELFLADVQGDEWTLDAGKVERVCRFAETFPYLEGPLAAKRLSLRLEPWQVWLLAALFGVVDAHGLRKHHQALVMIPRKNGKSTFAAVVALYMLAADHEPRAQVYIGARNLNQASYCFEPCRDMAQRAPGFARHYGATVTRKKIELRDGSFLERMIGDPPDGSNPHLGILDEAHENQNFGRQRQTMLTGMGARQQPLLLTITTAGFNEAGDCRALQAQCEQILAGELRNPRIFSAIWTVDRGDDWRDFSVWLKANPNVGVSFSEVRLRELYDTAMSVPSEKPGLLTKHLNVWQSSSDAWVNMRDWDEQATAPPLAGLINRGLRAWVGVDLSKVLDITAVGLLVELPGDAIAEGSSARLAYYPSIYLPELAVDRQPQNAAAYREWADAGHIRLTQDGATDYAAVEAALIALCRQFNVQVMGFDQWQAAMMEQRLMAENVPVVTYPQRYEQMHPPMSKFERMIATGELIHDGNPVVRWMTGNVVAARWQNFIKPVKPPRRLDAKIDGFVSLMMALGLNIAGTPEPVSYEVFLLD